MNDDNDYATEAGMYRYERAYQRALINNDYDYPDELHKQDVDTIFWADDEIVDISEV